MKKEQNIKTPMEHLTELNEPGTDNTKLNPILNFIERKKLQNRILQKMIEKINENDNQNSTKTK